MIVHDSCAPVRRAVYSLNFLLTLIAALVTYFITPLLLARGVIDSHIGFVYAGMAILTMVFLFAAPKIFSKFGNYRTFIALLAASSGILALLALFSNTILVVTLVMLYSSIAATTYLLLDMVLEGSMPQEGTTGGTRGLYITASEAAWFIGPVLAGWILGLGSFEMLFLIAAALSVPAISITIRQLRKIEHHEYNRPHISAFVRMFSQNKDIRGVFITQLLLRIFYASMVIYAPLYLIEHIGISYGNFGAILSIAMISYLIFEWPAGKLADIRFGEKEIMVIGFLVIACTTALLSVAFGTSVIVWGAILFGTRIGAALVDVTTESYFFKHVDGSDADIVSIFRMLAPVGYLIGALFGSIFLFFLPITYLFAAFGAIYLLGIPVALSITDTR